MGGLTADKRTRPILIAGLCFGLLAVQADEVHAQQSAVHGEWRSYGADRANTKYTPLAQIDRDNVSRLRVLWRRPGVDPKLTETFPDLNPSGDFRSTPLMLGGVLYTSNSVGLVEARSIPGPARRSGFRSPCMRDSGACPGGARGVSLTGAAVRTSGSSRCETTTSCR